MAWMGMRPLAVSCPPERRAAEAKGGRPAVLPDEDAGNGARLHGICQVRDVVRGQHLSDLGLDLAQLVHFVKIVDLEGIDRPVLVLSHECGDTGRILLGLLLLGI